MTYLKTRLIAALLGTLVSFIIAQGQPATSSIPASTVGLEKEAKKSESKKPGDGKPAVKDEAKPAAPGAALPPEKARPFVVPRFDHPPVIDGKLDDDIWNKAIVLHDFYQFQPGDNIAPTRPTEVRIGYDARFLYIAFHCYDDPQKVRATVAKRDQIFNEDNVRIFLDTFNDKRKAYMLGFNPFGIQADGIYTEGMGTDNAAIAHAAVLLEKRKTSRRKQPASKSTHSQSKTRR